MAATTGADSQNRGPVTGSLADDKRELTQARIRRAAMEVVARRGFDATVDEIAQASGVSSRTIFRYYESHDHLIVATVRDMCDAAGRRPIEGLPSPQEDFDGWLYGLATTIHNRNIDIVGDAFWDIHSPGRVSSGVLAEVAALRHEYRVRGVRYLAAMAWREAGGAGAPPESLVLAFALNFSGFATQALVTDFEIEPAAIGKLTGDILRTLLTQALEAQGDLAGHDADGGGPASS